MKKLSYLITAGVLLITLGTTSCKKSDDSGPTVEEQQLAALKGTWAATSVSDGNPRTDYGDFTLTFNNMSYITSGGPDLLPIPNGAAFAFGDNVKSKLILDPNNAALGYTYSISADGSTLTMNSDQTYSGEGFPRSRVSSVSGDWQFVFSKQ